MENKLSTLINNIKKLKTSYEKIFDDLLLKQDMALIDIQILGFLSNNVYDTARDIEEYLMLKKSNISNSIDTLIKRDLIERKRDEKDRRIIHLKVTENSKELIAEIKNLQETFFKSLFENIDKEALDVYFKVQAKLIENISRLD